jgi:hypothetical protein
VGRHQVAAPPPVWMSAAGVAGCVLALALFIWAGVSIRGRILSFAGEDDLPQFVHAAGPYAYRDQSGHAVDSRAELSARPAAGAGVLGSVAVPIRLARAPLAGGPRLLALCLMTGGCGYLMTFATAFAPALNQNAAFRTVGIALGVIALVGEFGMCIWLLVNGAALRSALEKDYRDPARQPL